MNVSRSIDVPGQVVAVVATYRRREALARLLAIWSGSTEAPHAVVVADNAVDPAVRALVEGFRCPGSGEAGVYVPSPGNPGCGAGLRLAEAEALARYPGLTHLWILDDDALPGPGVLPGLLEALEESGSGMSVPFLTDEQGALWAHPEPSDPGMAANIRKHTDPVRMARELGKGPHACLWATGACMMVSRRALDCCGLHRADFFMLGEDLEFSMRVARIQGAVFRADLVVPHLPPAPEPGQSPAALRWHRVKFAALLQNLCYLAVHQPGPHRRRLWRYLPGNFLRWFRTFGVHPMTLGVAAVAGMAGLFLAQPSGASVGSWCRRVLLRG